jgi:translocation and assembly module TamA
MIFMRNFFLFLFFLLISISSLGAAEPVELVIDGIEGDAIENIRSALTLPVGIVTEGVVNSLWLDYYIHQVPEKVKKALEPFGYYSANVDVHLNTLEEDRHYRISVKIDPGTGVHVSSVNLSITGPGIKEESMKNLLTGFPLREGDILSHSSYEKAKGELKAHAVETGYLDADFTEHLILVSVREKTAQIHLSLETGPLYRFGETRFDGAPDYPDRFLKRYLSYKSGDRLSSAKIRGTQKDFINSERFLEVIIAPEKEQEENLHVPVLVRLKPAPSRKLRTGVGYGTDTGARMSLGYSDLNSLDRGNEVRAELNLAERRQGIGVNYLLPSYTNINNSTGFQFNLLREDIDTYETSSVSLEINRNRSFGKGRIGTIYLKLQYEDSTIASESLYSFLVLPGVRFSERRYDNLIRPTRGHRYSVEVRGTHKSLGSSTGLIQVLADGSVIFSLPWRLSLTGRLQGAVTMQEETIGDIPASLRFFTGGDRSVRGYKYLSLGPENNKGEVVGGKHLLVGSVELERALFSDWGIAAFYDAGNSFDSLTDIRLFQGAGMGIRYYTQIGAIRLDLARQIDVDDPDFRIHFGIGIEL